jgi:hypothetical protein
MRYTADVTGDNPIAVLLQSISGVCAINPLVAFYDIHGGKREVLLFYFVPDTTRDRRHVINNNNFISTANDLHGSVVSAFRKRSRKVSKVGQ